MRLGTYFVASLLLALSACSTKMTNVEYKEHAQLKPDLTIEARISSIAPLGFRQEAKFWKKWSLLCQSTTV